MKTKRKWMLLVGIIAAAVGALAGGVPAGTLLFFGAALLCPAMMLFGMGGTGHGGCHGGRCEHAGAHAARNNREDRELKQAK